jgi:hypothetical protein
MKHSDDEQPRELVEAVDPADFPVLEGFLLAYLHEDFELAYGSPAAAMDAFLADGGTEDFLALAREWHDFKQRVERFDDEHRLDQFGHLGAAWQPETWSDVETLFERLRHVLLDAGG